MVPCLGIRLVHSAAVVPTRAHDTDAGYDLYSVERVVIPKGECRAVRTGVSVVLPLGTYGRIAPRSSVSMSNVFVNAGVVDRGFTGELKVVLAALGEEYVVAKGAKIAQLILERIETLPVQVCDDVPETERGAGGFGSTGS